VNTRRSSRCQRLLRDAIKPVIRQSRSEFLPRTSGRRFSVKDDREGGQLRLLTFVTKLELQSKLHIALTTNSSRINDARIDQGDVGSVDSQLEMVCQPVVQSEYERVLPL